MQKTKACNSTNMVNARLFSNVVNPHFPDVTPLGEVDMAKLTNKKIPKPNYR